MHFFLRGAPFQVLIVSPCRRSLNKVCFVLYAVSVVDFNWWVLDWFPHLHFGNIPPLSQVCTGLGWAWNFGAVRHSTVNKLP